MNYVVSSRNDIFNVRSKKHDEAEEEVMNTIRPYTNRRHMPDRWIAFNGNICAWDMKTTIFVEKNSHDEYFRLLQENNIKVFIVYEKNGYRFADWIQNLEWEGPKPPSPRSTCNDPYYVISGGMPLKDFLEQQKNTNGQIIQSKSQ